MTVTVTTTGQPYQPEKPYRFYGSGARVAMQVDQILAPANVRSADLATITQQLLAEWPADDGGVRLVPQDKFWDIVSLHMGKHP